MFDSLKEVNIRCRVYFLFWQQACTVLQIVKFLLMQNSSNFSSVSSKMQLSDLFLPFRICRERHFRKFYIQNVYPIVYHSRRCLEGTDTTLCLVKLNFI